MYGFGKISGIDLHGLGIIGRSESAEHRGHGWAERH
jgi:hypothetical protein